MPPANVYHRTSPVRLLEDRGGVHFHPREVLTDLPHPLTGTLRPGGWRLVTGKDAPNALANHVRQHLSFTKPS